MSNYSIANKVITITGDLTSDEVSLIGTLAAAGYEVKTADVSQSKPKKKRRNGKPNPSKGRNREFYEKALTAEQFKEFERIEKEKKYISAAQWANKQLAKAE